MPPKRTALGQLVDNILNSKRDTEVSETLKEIELNNEYIENVQLKKLLKLHDHSFQMKCVVPAKDLYSKYYESTVEDMNIQNDAALIDRDLRIAELTLNLVKQRQLQDTDNNQ